MNLYDMYQWIQYKHIHTVLVVYKAEVAIRELQSSSLDLPHHCAKQDRFSSSSTP